MTRSPRYGRVGVGVYVLLECLAARNDRDLPPWPDEVRGHDVAGWRERLGFLRRGLSASPPDHGAWDAKGAPKVPARPPLDDAEERAALLRRRGEEDPSAAIAGLEALRAAHAPDAFVLHALCLVYQRSGRVADAVAVAREAVPLCFRNGRGLLVAEMFEALDADADALGIGRPELLALGGALGRTVHWQLAFRALANVVMRDPADVDATRELVRIADWLRDQQCAADEAETICAFLRIAGADVDVVEALSHRNSPHRTDEPERPVDFDAERWLALSE